MRFFQFFRTPAKRVSERIPKYFDDTSNNIKKICIKFYITSAKVRVTSINSLVLEIGNWQKSFSKFYVDFNVKISILFSQAA